MALASAHSSARAPTICPSSCANRAMAFVSSCSTGSSTGACGACCQRGMLLYISLRWHRDTWSDCTACNTHGRADHAANKRARCGEHAGCMRALLQRSTAPPAHLSVAVLEKNVVLAVSLLLVHSHEHTHDLCASACVRVVVCVYVCVWARQPG